MTDKTPHELGLCAAEKDYVRHIEYRAMDYAVKKYLRTLLSDERVIDSVSVYMRHIDHDDENYTGIAKALLNDIKRIAGVE